MPSKCTFFYVLFMSYSFLYSNTVESICGKRIVMFSYGSGLAACMFSLRVVEDRTPDSALERLVSSLRDLQERLDSRHKVSPSDFDQCMKLRQETHHLGMSLLSLMIQ